MKLPAASNYSGFSLVELLLAVFLSGIIVLIVANIPAAINLVSNSQDESKVREVAAKKMEDIRLSGYDGIEVGTATFSDPLLSKLTQLQATTTVAPCPTEICTNAEEVKQVTIRISWTEEAVPKNFQVVSLIAKNGLR